ncbi:MAG TPA: hypothetical protein VJ161_06790 [Geobacteraceae bacterium]|nr:hypothetical protein [Geobacteraceae bacterium]
MKYKKILIGCGIAALFVVVVLSVAAYSMTTAFVKFGIGTDLSDYRDAILKMDIDSRTRKYIVRDLEAVRLSLDRKNNFGFLQWLEIDDSIQGIIADGKIVTDEYDPLQADIARMKKIQGLRSTSGA